MDVINVWSLIKDNFKKEGDGEIKRNKMFYTIEMSSKCLLDVFWPVLPRNIFRNPIKSLWWSIFAKIVNYF